MLLWLGMAVSGFSCGDAGGTEDGGGIDAADDGGLDAGADPGHGDEGDGAPDSGDSQAQDAGGDGAADGEADGDVDGGSEDGGGDESTIDCSIQGPVATPVGPLVVQEDSSVEVVLTGTDGEDPEDQLRVRVTRPPASGSVDQQMAAAPHTVVYQPGPDFHGSDSFEFKIFDSDDCISEAETVLIEITPLNDAPVARSDAASCEPDTSVSVPVLQNDSDVDGDTLSVVEVGNASNGTTSTDGSQVSYTPAGGFQGRDSFSYTVEDPDGASASGTVRVWVTPGGSEHWFGLAGSDFGPWSTYLTWGSATGGGVTNSAANSATPQLTIDSQGRLVLAWDEEGDIFVLRESGGIWEEFAGSGSGGGISDNAGDSVTPALALDADDNPVVAWSDDTPGAAQIFVKRFDGVAWQEVGAGSASGGGMTDNAGDSVTPSLALDDNGWPVIAWCDDTDGDWEIRVKHFDGSVPGGSWLAYGPVSDGTISPGNSRSTSPTLALDSSDFPVVAFWSYAMVGSQIVAMRFNGSNWRKVGDNTAGANISNTDGYSREPSIAVDGFDNPYVAWSDNDSGDYEIYIRRFDGADWVEVGTGSAGGGGVSDNDGVSESPSLLLDSSDNPILAWSDTTSGPGLYLARFDDSVPGGTWVEVGAGSMSGTGINSTLAGTDTPSLARGPSGELAVAWSTGFDIYLRRFDGAGWPEVHGGTASGGALSNTAGDSGSPELAMDLDGFPMVAWSDSTTGNAEIYILRYDGSVPGGAWQEFPAGSASGPGLSGTEGRSTIPNIVLNGNGQPVMVWQDQDPVTYVIYAKWYDGMTWNEVETGSASGDGIYSNGQPSRWPVVAIDYNGKPVVAWSQDAGAWGYPIYVLRATGAGWTEVVDSSASSWGISHSSNPSWYPALAIDRLGNRVVVWAQETDNYWEIMVRYFDQWNGWRSVESWFGANGISGNDNDSWNPDVVIDGDGTFIVTWHEQVQGRSQIYVLRYDGEDWTELGPDSASFGGISDSPGNARYPSITLDSNNRPVIAWCDEGSGQYQIYVKAFDATMPGGAWIELGQGSASGGGVSNSGTSSQSPTLSAGEGFLCVAWSETGETSKQVVIRCAAE